MTSDFSSISCHSIGTAPFSGAQVIQRSVARLLYGTHSTDKHKNRAYFIGRGIKCRSRPAPELKRPGSSSKAARFLPEGWRFPMRPDVGQIGRDPIRVLGRPLLQE